MAQIYSKREPSRFQPELDVNHLVAYTTHILVNRKYFPEEVQQTIVPSTIALVLEAAEKTNIANEISVKPSLPLDELKSHYTARTALQKDALRNLHLIKSRIKIFKVGYHLAYHKANAWTTEVNSAISSISAWYNSEMRKLREL